MGRFFGSLSVPVLPPVGEVKQKKVRVKKAAAAAAAAPEEDKVSVKSEEKSSVDGRKRVVSKKMCEAFLALAVSLNRADPAADLEAIKTAYKTLSDEELQQKGGDFTSFMHHFLTGAAPAPKETKTKAKKEKMPTRIERWTPTLTRTLTKIVEENGGKMDDKHKKSFHEWVDALTEEQFKSTELAGHMRTWVSTTLVVAPATPMVEGPTNAAAPLPLLALPSSLLTEDDAEEEDEDLEEFEHEGETLSIGVKTGKIYRPTPAGDIWVGNAGVGRFSAVKRPE